MTRERLAHCETKESYYYSRSFRKLPQRRTRDNELMDRILLCAVQSQGQRRSISTKLSPEREDDHTHPSQRSGGCSKIIEEREVSWKRQHPSRAGQSRWEGRNHRSHDNLQQELAGRRMANSVDTVLGHHTSQQRQPAALPELPNDQPRQPPKQIHSEDHTEQIEAASEDHC